MIAYIALGTNMGERKSNIDMAVSCVSTLPLTTVLNVSKLYETTPVGYLEQADFYNAVIKVDTQLSAKALLGACLGIETAMGRVREIVNGPRVIDLDLLLYENEKYDTKELILPHPRMNERAFVIYPLCDVLPSDEYINLRDSMDKSDVRCVSDL